VPVTDMDVGELIELSNQPMCKRNTTEMHLERIADAGDECKRRGIELSPGRTRRAPHRRDRTAAR